MCPVPAQGISVKIFISFVPWHKGLEQSGCGEDQAAYRQQFGAEEMQLPAKGTEKAEGGSGNRVSESTSSDSNIGTGSREGADLQRQ